VTIKEELALERDRNRQLLIEVNDVWDGLGYQLDLAHTIHEDVRRIHDLMTSGHAGKAMAELKSLREWMDEEFYDPMIDDQSEVVA
jgi:hypothetical protein